MTTTTFVNRMSTCRVFSPPIYEVFIGKLICFEHDEIYLYKKKLETLQKRCFLKSKPSSSRSYCLKKLDLLLRNTGLY